MSHYTTTELEVKDIDSFVEALVECWPMARGLEISKKDIEIHDEPVNLVGYMGDNRDQKANIVIRRKNVGSASNDIGFLVKDGKATAYISEFDNGAGYKQKWQNRVKQQYAINVTKKAAKQKGYKVTETWVDGKCKLEATKYVTVG